MSRFGKIIFTIAIVVWAFALAVGIQQIRRQVVCPTCGSPVQPEKLAPPPELF